MSADIEAVLALASPYNLAALIDLNACLEALPGAPQVTVFDTAFHQTMPKAAYTHAVPRPLYLEHGIHRYGFHGTSHRYVAGGAVRGLDPKDHGLN